MPLIIEILVVWALGALGALAYQKFRGRAWGEAAHLASIFGIFIALVYFLGLLILDFTT